jgi:hypothetical protein
MAVVASHVRGPWRTQSTPQNGTTGRHLASRAVIVNPEKRRAAQNLSLFAAVLLVRGIAPINKRGFTYLWRRGD